MTRFANAVSGLLAAAAASLGDDSRAPSLIPEPTLTYHQPWGTESGSETPPPASRRGYRKRAKELVEGERVECEREVMSCR